MLDLEVFIGEFFSIYGSSTSSITLGEISSLDHEVFDYPMEDTSCISLLKANPPVLVCEKRKTNSLGFFGKFDEVFGSFRDSLSKKTNDDSSSWLIPNCNVKINL